MIAFADVQIGPIAPGYRTDFVVLARLPFDADVVFSAISPTAVYVDGRLVLGTR